MLFLSENQQRILQKIVNGQSRCDHARLYEILRSMLPRDIVRNGKITITDDKLTISAYGKRQTTNLKTD